MRSLRALLNFIVDIYKNRRLLISLAKNDIKTRYLGSYLGILWAFIQPLATIFVMWFVFSVGFRSAPVDDYPFILWLISGLIPWFFVQETILGCANSIVENSYLVKKIVFNVNLLPLIKLLSSLFVHFFFIIIMLVFFISYGYLPGIHAIQIIYYLFAAIFLLVGLSLISSGIVVFVRDLGQVISVLLQFLFWGTPIVWSLNIMPVKYHFLFKLNPVHYIVNGYREALVYDTWFWQHPLQTVYFWVLSAIIFFIGAILFKRLKPHFADVL